MRIIVVSALYPPNFIGGATVQAQRLARAFQARGHEVWVFAGSLDDRRDPLESWDETDETGVRVRWVATTPWFGFGDERNYSNPCAEDAFDRFLAEVGPVDVVHFHAMQALGGGLAAVAARRNARVVVTMHDWWWFCARQFLADRSFVPCCPVVDAGVCPCEVDRPWLEQRRRWLDEQLQAADIILAPSAIAVESLVSNGVDPGIIEVDENGLPDPLIDDPHASEQTLQEGPVRFIYAGGSHELKGVHVLLEAAGLLGPSEKWRLDAYGAEPYVVREGIDLGKLPVRTPDAYAPSESGQVFGAADVLVLPSVMRESHSLLTREALTRGVPVICTDSLGPEEVVTHLVNGLIVPSADAESLATAMRTLVEDRDLLLQLKKGSSSVPVRSLEDQVEGLLAKYEAPLPGSPAPKDRVKGVLFIAGIEGAPLRYRAWLPSEALALVGIDSEVKHYQDPSLEQILPKFDALVVYRVPATVRMLSIIDRAKELGMPVLFDVDDLIFDPDLADEIPAMRILPKVEAARWIEGVSRYRITMEACDLFVGSTPALCDYAETKVGLPSQRFANGVGIRLGKLSDAALKRPRRPGPVRVAYLSGTDTHDHDWHFVEPAVMAALEAVPDAELWMIGHLPDTPAVESLGDRVRRFKLQPWDELPDLLRSIDVNLAPLEPGSRFNEAKSAIKWLEAALVCLPTVASPTEPFREAITHGHDGMLAESMEDWTNSIVHLMTDRQDRLRMGTMARRTALHRWSPWLQGRRYAEIIDQARSLSASGAGPQLVRPMSRSPRFVHDEPVRPHPLEPYNLTVAFHRSAPAMPTARLERGSPIETSFVCQRDGLTRVDVIVATYGKPDTTLAMRLRRADEVVAEATARAEDIEDKSWVSFEFAPIDGSKGQEFVAEIEARTESSGPTSIALWANADGYHIERGRRRAGDVSIRAWAIPDEGGWEPPTAARKASPAEWLRAKVRFGAYTLRTSGLRGILSWVRRAIYLRTKGSRRGG